MMDAENAMRQAWMTANVYLTQAQDHIDNLFGAGYARAHPELVIQFMKVCIKDYELAMKYTH
jgi:hypothetical protein